MMLARLKQLFGSRVSVRACLWLGIALLGILGLWEAGAWEVHKVRLKSRIRQAIPRVRQETSQELRLLTGALEDYKSQFGCYPPDHLVSQNPVVVDSITNPLLYELLGTIYETTNDSFTPLDHFPTISGKLVKRFFNVGSFKNSAARPDLVRRFIRATDVPGTYGVSEKPDVGVLAFFPNWEGIDPELLQEFSLAPWQYNRSKPVHNPKSYDLWIEVPISDSKITVGNW